MFRIGLGNYDLLQANILVAALELKELSVVWFDRRLSVNRINHEAVMAYIFNVPSISYIPFMKGRHWFTVRRFDDHYYNLDSKLQSAVRIDDFVAFSNQILAEGNQLLLVTRPEDQEKCINRGDEET
uniref:ubiquitinyl hydrolase 1 n=1 Tax=Ditylenchus dipsaci TaxID=166011 RepID=A0A915CPE3_9BILA